MRTIESLSITTERGITTSPPKAHPLHKQSKPPQSAASPRISSYSSAETYQPSCYACNQRHLLVKCLVFEKMPLKDRLALVNTKRICSNCFRDDHFARKCPSNYSCRICQKRHHTLLHPGFETNDRYISSFHGGPSQRTVPLNSSSNIARYESDLSSSSNSTQYVSSNSVSNSKRANVFLSTVVLVILDGYGGEHPARALLDSGSQCSLMSDQLCQRLRLIRRRMSKPIYGVGESQIRVLGSVSTEIRSRVGAFALYSDFLVLRNITANLPAVTIPKESWTIPEGIQLADPDFNVSRKVDLIIGAEHFYSLLKGGRIDLGNPSPTLIESEFGWFMSGKSTYGKEPECAVTCCVSTLENLEKKIERFWQIEDIDAKIISPNEQICEDFYRQTVKRDETGRYIVKYPKVEGFPKMIGDSYLRALRRLEVLERKLVKNPQLKERYHDFMAEFLSLGHMRVVSADEPDPPVTCYLPHHPILKESSTTTKVRGVFDASAKTSTGFSLNESLRVGPVIQDELTAIIIRFRKYKVALLADIEKMYRQVNVHSDDRPLQRILWRFSQNQPVTKYELTTVTYGLAPSSFSATRTLWQLADDEGASFPLAAPAVKRDFYMDDFIRGESSIESAIQLRKEMTELLKRGGFRLRKWCSNMEKVLEGVPTEDLVTQSIRSLDPDATIKTLGISWEPFTDQFRFDFDVNTRGGPTTKRSMLSTIARLYDPLGLISPIIIRAKIQMQQLWTLSLDWDEEVPSEIKIKWNRFLEELPKLEKFRIDRYALLQGQVQLHSFADASEDAYGACIYVRSKEEDGRVKIVLLASKSRVAPLRKRSIPRLELCAAQLAAHLFVKVRTALDINISSSWFWSDSMVVLHWLHSPPHVWKTFISNRIADIQILTHGSKWRHVPGASNPADLVSRGLPVEQFLRSEMWVHGPAWLLEGEDSWPKQEYNPTDHCNDTLERKTTNLVVQDLQPPNPIITRFSSYLRLIRSIAYCFRFARFTRDRIQCDSILLSTEELDNARNALIKIVQQECYNQEMHALNKGKPVPKQSSLKLLDAFIDATGIIRVGGRLKLSAEPYETKHPILLPGFHHFTRLILMFYHRKTYHGGISLTLSVTRNEFWPVNGRRAVRSVIRTCYRCARSDPKPFKQPVGQIPAARLVPSRPFATTGIDYCGPVFVKGALRKSPVTKSYIAIFVCFSTKAVHIELVGDLSTAAFLSALRRFISRRGLPEQIFSDNATNFSGARNELNALYHNLNNRTSLNRIATSLATEGIKWQMIPPRAPNFGGLWEAAVKVAKKHIVRELGDSSLLHEDLITALTQIEGYMNSRPLCPLSDDPNDLEAITPGHFLIGSSLLALPEPDYTGLLSNRLDRFKFIQQKCQHFWLRWKGEYLKELQRLTAINPRKIDLKVGQVVILQDQQLPPTRWPLARIIQVHPGPDDIVRVATLRTANGIFRRPASKLCPLPSTFDHAKDEDTQQAADYE